MYECVSTSMFIHIYTHLYIHIYVQWYSIPIFCFDIFIIIIFINSCELEIKGTDSRDSGEDSTVKRSSGA